MVQEIFCGIDFGTSNSSMATVMRGQMPKIIALENQSSTLPSTIFYEKGKTSPVFGREALSKYISGEEGRLMRSLKRVLGTDLMATGTILNGKSVKFENILTQFIMHMKKKAEQNTQQDIQSVVMGRPVHFGDNDIKGDAAAQQQLENIAKNSGFKNVLFQYEPIAAAYAHEENIEGEKLACVVDIGGGTSDFSIIKLGKNLKNKIDRSEDILANTGIRIGGNDFDKDLSIKAFMPEFGLRTTYGEKNLYVPSSQYFDMSEWSKINQAYTYKNLKIIKEILTTAHEPQKYSRLLELYEKECGHKLLWHVEQCKIDLTEHKENTQILDFMDEKFAIKTQQETLNQSILEDLAKINHTIDECLAQAGIKPQQIDLIVLTGGSTEIPFVKEILCKQFKNASISDKNKLISVGYGLACDAIKKF